MKKILVLLTILLSFALSANAVQYEIVDLGSMGGIKGYAYDINNNGQIIGRYELASGNTRSFFMKMER